jgi:hypothetical protein
MANDIQAAYDELYVYTMGRPAFILQHVVDAHMAQTGTDASKAIGVMFALIGLYLHVEKGFTGSQVQRVHQLLGQRKLQWPHIDLPTQRGNITAREVLAAAAGSERDAAIHRWCESVWQAFGQSRDRVVRILQEQKIA